MNRELKHIMQVHPGIASPVASREYKTYDTPPRHFGAEIVSLSLWRNISGIEKNSPRDKKYPRDNVIEITSDLTGKGIRLDFSNNDGKSKNVAGEFTIFNQETREPVKIDPYTNMSFNTDTVAWRIREMFTQEEVDTMEMGFKMVALPADEKGDELIPVQYITFNQKGVGERSRPHIWPNENIVGLAFILRPGEEGLMKGEIYPLLVPDSIDHEIVGDYERHNGEQWLINPEKLKEVGIAIHALISYVTNKTRH